MQTAQKPRISAVVSAGDKIHAFDGHRIVTVAFVDMGADQTKLAALVHGDLTDDDLIQLLNQLRLKVGMDRLMNAAGELALSIEREGEHE